MCFVVSLSVALMNEVGHLRLTVMHVLTYACPDFDEVMYAVQDPETMKAIGVAMQPVMISSKK